ncbi:DUF1540 domain-containing protein [Verrucomicrobiota bacterium]
MKMTIDMPCIQDCSVTECTYNHDKSCHARAVTIGDGTHPGCDTFFNSGKHCGSMSMAGVGACKVSACMFNTDFECQASEIQVDSDSSGAICKTCKLG